MDSLTQAALGAGVAAVCVPAADRRKALLVGALLGTLPDLDVLIDYGDAVANFTKHRGFSHSLFVLPPLAVLLWLALRRSWDPVRESPGPWLLAILLALVTHPLLDAHTAYGTQLLWPLPMPPVMWSTLFIIDPLYTLPLVLAGLLVAVWPLRRWSRRALVVGIASSSLYLGWSWVAKEIVERNARDALAAMQLSEAPLYSVPSPFNTLLWRVVVMTGDGYLEGFDSLVIDEGPIRFERNSIDTALIESAAGIQALRRLDWFASGFIRIEADNGRLVVTDLRMGQEPKYVFSHAIAERSDSGWREIPSERLPLLVTRGDVAAVWRRLFAR